ncbi:MAG: hypothetical protein K0S28_1910, partial [Paucimonas sp.]|nr:hypothetical protein [Paucimonas sp.]
MFNWLQALLGNKEKRIGKTVPVKELPEAVNDVLDTEVRATVFSPLDTAMPAPASREHVVSVVTPMQRSEANAAYAAWLFEWKERKDGDLFASTAENTILNTVQQVVKSDQPAANLVRRMPGVVPQL